ncbi:MAG: 4Fe-4S dicluster domain-containing protein [Methanobacteriota archaeon]|nr:MAG: 4Fe-4S dicluster domain-containing protein [Euryarchaeota archaeon]
MAKAIVPFPEVCTGCRLCEMACSLKHENVLNVEKSRIRVTKEGVRLDVPIVCTQGNACEQECAEVCPVDCIKVVEGSAIEVVEEDCTGCEACVDACPFACIWMKNEVAVKCDLCHGDPTCVKFCPQQAILYLEGSEEGREEKWKEAKALVGGD